MRNTFSWSCSCGEYNVIDLTGKAGPQIRCEFCFHPVQATPDIFEGSSAEPPSQPPSDAWIGNAVIRPFFSAAPRPGASIGRAGGRKDRHPSRRVAFEAKAVTNSGARMIGGGSRQAARVP